VVAGWRVCVLVACWAWCHLVVALGAGAGLVGALWGGGGIGRELIGVVPANTGEEHLLGAQGSGEGMNRS
jgi:hypothetical protein